MPLDSGLIRKNVEYHDAVYSLSAPFNGTAKELFKTKMRYAGTSWGNETLALVQEISRTKQIGRISRFNSATGSLEL
ncbi:hypothetical protein, partial [Staphylococcus aureus]